MFYECKTIKQSKQTNTKQMMILSQHFFLKGWDEAREIHAYPPGKNIFFAIITIVTLFIFFTTIIVTFFKTLMMTCLSSGEERSLQKI